ncbi:unnamed protein product [Moneuplotes crassus]|uniref:START domain-containing protein n=1 Tax=Euplotes crassus TaxID=5936 RepID=A0AAD2CWL7_EUPCR|nr:unnamed protein product [Moneuplotes crassus]
MESTSPQFPVDATTLLPPAPTLEESISEELLTLLLKSREKFTEGITLFSDEKWELKKDKEEAKLWTKKAEEGGVKLFRREAVIEKSAEVVDEWLSDQENVLERVANNNKLKHSDVVKKFNEDAKLIRREIKGNLLVTNRDMCLFWNRLNLTDGSIAHVMFSIEHEDIPKTKCVRAEAKINLLILKPISDESCMLSNIGKVDPKGSIPTAFVNKMLVKQYDDLLKLKKSVEA